jgi:SNF2 family DNA or RNA helicase
MAIKFKIGAVDAQTICAVAVGDYNSTLHNLFLGFPEKKWNKKRRGWDIPVTQPNLAYLSTTFKQDEYELTANAATLIKYESLVHQVEEKRASKRWEYLFEDRASTFDPPYTRKPFMHQLVATESAIGSESFGHLMEMGTGKTFCITLELDYYACTLKAGEMLRIVIVCPKSLVVNWRREMYMGICGVHNVDMDILMGDIKSIDQMIAVIAGEARIKVLIVSYDSVSTMIQQLLAFKPSMVVFDESHYVKNPEAKRSKACNTLAKESTMKRILTGTPVSNNILDLWHQFELLRPGALGFGTYRGFKNEYAYVEKNGGFETVTGFKEDKIDKLKEDMARMSFVVKKERCLDLPQKIFEIRAIEMPDTLRQVYKKMAQEFYVMLEDGTESTTEFIIVQMLKLSQLCCGFLSGYEGVAMEDIELDSDSEPVRKTKITTIPGGDAKLNNMLDDVEDVVADGTKLIIWSRFKQDNQLILKQLRERGVNAVIYDGSVDAVKKQAAVDGFNTDDSVKVFIGNVKSGGVGLTLLGTKTCPCHTVFYYSNDFSYGTRAQSEDRCHRIGQTNKVLYRDYIYADSIEEYIVDVLRDKRELSDMVKNVAAIKNILLKASA